MIDGLFDIIDKGISEKKQIIDLVKEYIAARTYYEEAPISYTRFTNEQEAYNKLKNFINDRS